MHQIESFAGFSAQNLTADDMANPTAVQLLGGTLNYVAREKMALEQEIRILKDELREAHREREDYRVRLSALEHANKYQWLNLPVGVLGGAGLPMIMEDPSGVVGWLLVLFSFLFGATIHRISRGA